MYNCSDRLRFTMLGQQKAPSHNHAAEFKENTVRGNGTDRKFFMKPHRASRIHFDFRLQHDGVLKSWVIPDGPCLDISEHRAAFGDPGPSFVMPTKMTSHR